MATIGARLRTLDERLVGDAAEWAIRPRVARLLLVGPIVAAFALAALLPFPALFNWLVKEDSVIEWLQAVALIVAGVMFLRLAIGLFRGGRRSVGLLFAAIAVVAFVVAGEEASWGQRIFGWLTPTDLDNLNHQGETNIHNIGPVQRVFNLAGLTAGLYGVAAPLIWASGLRPRRIRAADRFLLIPPVCLITFFLLPFAYRLVRLVLLPEAGRRITTYGELPELTLYSGAMVFAFLAVRVASEARRRDTGTVTPRR